MQSLYDPEFVRPMWQELDKIGVRSLRTPEEVDTAALNTPGTTLLVVNSICGCAAGHARPGVALALQHKTIPDHLTTVFAGVDREATMRARELMKDVPPSSPSVALFKDGQLVYMLHRSQIERMDISGIARNLTEAFDRYCSASGPSVPSRVMEEIFNVSRGWRLM